MIEDSRSIRVAIGLMRMAHALLDREGETTGAARLQDAIDAILELRALKPEEELSPETACLVAGIPLGEERP